MLRFLQKSNPVRLKKPYNSLCNILYTTDNLYIREPLVLCHCLDVHYNLLVTAMRQLFTRLILCGLLEWWFLQFNGDFEQQFDQLFKTIIFTLLIFARSSSYFVLFEMFHLIFKPKSSCLTYFLVDNFFSLLWKPKNQK